MTKFLLFIIILNFLVVIYNIYMWFTVQVQNKLLESENERLTNSLYQMYRINIRRDEENKKD